MKLFYYTNGQLFTSSHEPAAPFLPRTSAITLGTFDGVHLGHRKIISALTSKAHAAHLQSVLITFEPHPRTVVAKKDAQPVQLLTTTDEKIALLSALHLDAVVIINFTKAFSELSPETFVEKILLKRVWASSDGYWL
jgi:riboflavin kinase/FMN adenylyltransferase